jgi:hypothetical protein
MAGWAYHTSGPAMNKYGTWWNKRIVLKEKSVPLSSAKNPT